MLSVALLGVGFPRRRLGVALCAVEFREGAAGREGKQRSRLWQNSCFALRPVPVVEQQVCECRILPEIEIAGYESGGAAAGHVTSFKSVCLL